VTHVITSDTHLGCRYFDPARLTAFLAALPPGAELIIAGDVVDRSTAQLKGAHRAALDALIALSKERHVVWVRGNHDRHIDVTDLGDIELVETYAIGKRVLIAHGHHFDTIMPTHRWFIHLVRAVQALRILLGADAVHVARYAKRFPTLYGILRDHVARNAIEHAREHGFEAIVCGHTHHAETREADGIHYVNTGAWTEDTPHYVMANDETMTLHEVPPFPVSPGEDQPQ